MAEQIGEIVQRLTDENEKQKALIEMLVGALEKIAHIGVDFGHGPFECNPIEVAQQALKEAKGMG